MCVLYEMLPLFFVDVHRGREEAFRGCICAVPSQRYSRSNPVVGVRWGRICGPRSPTHATASSGIIHDCFRIARENLKFESQSLV